MTAGRQRITEISARDVRLGLTSLDELLCPRQKSKIRARHGAALSLFESDLCDNRYEHFQVDLAVNGEALRISNAQEVRAEGCLPLQFCNDCFSQSRFDRSRAFDILQAKVVEIQR